MPDRLYTKEMRKIERKKSESYLCSPIFTATCVLGHSQSVHDLPKKEKKEREKKKRKITHFGHGKDEGLEVKFPMFV